VETPRENLEDAKDDVVERVDEGLHNVDDALHDVDEKIHPVDVDQPLPAAPVGSQPEPETDDDES